MPPAAPKNPQDWAIVVGIASYPGFQNHDLDPGPRKIGGSHQAVVASADNDGLERSQFGSLYARYSAGKPAAPTATTMYCLPFSM